MRLHPVPFRMTLAALAASALLAACGGGDATPPLDILPPSLAISDNVTGATATGPVTFTFTFNEAVAGFDASDIVVSGGTAGAFTMGATNRSATLVVTPGDNTTGTLQLSVAADSFTDLAGNANTTAASASQAFDTTVGSPPPVTNLIANGDFSNGGTGWTGNALNVVTDGGNSFNLADVAVAGNSFNVNLSYPLSIPTQGIRYRLTFTASSNRARTLIAGIGLSGAPFTNTTETVNLTTTNQTFTVDLTANFASAESRVLFDMGADTGTVVIDDVVLEVIPLIANGNFSNGTAGWIGTGRDVRTEGGNSFNFANVTSAGNPFDVNLSYPLSIPTQGVRYRLTFTASSDRARTLVAGIGLSGAPFTNTTETVNLTTTNQTFTVELTANFASAESRVLFDMGAEVGIVVIDDVVLEVIPLIANGNFSNGTAGWIGTGRDVRTEGGNSFNFANVTSAGNPFDVNLSYPLSIPTQGVRYRLTFTASSDRARTLVAGIGLSGAPFTNTTETVNLTTTNQTFTVELTANFASAESRVLFDMGAQVGIVVIDDVVLEVID